MWYMLSPDLDQWFWIGRLPPKNGLQVCSDGANANDKSQLAKCNHAARRAKQIIFIYVFYHTVLKQKTLFLIALSTVKCF